MNTQPFHLFFLPALIVILGLMLAGHALAQIFTTLHSFTNAIDGADPQASLILSSNIMYGTTTFGGSFGNGTVFKVNTDGTGFKTLYSLNAVTNGAGPYAGLILSSNTLYGTASVGGLVGTGAGVVFKVNTNGTGFTNLHSFSKLLGPNPPYYNSDGGIPHCRLILSSNTLYGTTAFGGSLSNGTVFAVNTNGTGFRILHNFAGYPSDGGNPYAGLVMSSNTLYGTTYLGGTNNNNAGTVFTINTDGTGYTNLHSFILESDGANPRMDLSISGNILFGTTLNGGGGGFGGGTVFKLNTDGTNFKTLYDFNLGSQPFAGLILSSNTLYGTLRAAGIGFGTVFSVNTDGASFTNLYTFTALDVNTSTNKDGANPYAGLVLSGNILFGTTYNGGSLGKGTVFRLSLPVPLMRPSMRIATAGNKIILSWPTNASSFTLQSITNLSSGSWSNVTSGITAVGTNYTFTNTVNGKASFFRLIQ